MAPTEVIQSTRGFAMPVFTKGSMRFLFIHIPKTGGSSVENHFAKMGWSVDYLDTSDPSSPESKNFCRRVSPQHMHSSLLAETFDLSKFDLIFAVIRDPVERFRSEFAYRNPELADVEIVEHDVEAWWFEQKLRLQENPYHLDNHLRRQSEFLLPGTKVFRFDTDLAQVAKLADESLFSDGTPGTVEVTLPHSHSSWNYKRLVPISKKLNRELTKFYRPDFRISTRMKDRGLRFRKS